MHKTDFGKTKEGQQVTKYTLVNKNGMEISVIDYGATIVSVKVPVGEKKYDVVLGYDSAADYQKYNCYFGTVVGRNCNRIAQAKVTLDGKEYQMEKNDNGENNLHCGKNGFSKKIWTVEEVGESIITFSYLSRDMEQDLPGNMTAKVTYRLTDENELVISYEAVTDKTTVANFTNHTYFNLDGHDSGKMENQQLEILASYYTPVSDSKSIPTGDIVKVAGTPMDFRKMKPIGAEINADFDQLKFAGGYDHNFVLDKADGSLQLAARAKAAKSGICMDVYTDCVGLQFYAGNFIGEQTGKDGAIYNDRHGFCLETQYFPNAINEKNFKAPILKPGEKYQSVTKYCFQVEK